jgi:PqqD family protein of HPr-rel-A system
MASQPVIGNYPVIKASNSQVSCELNGEYVVLHTNSGNYFSLDGPAAFIWELLQKPTTDSEIVQAILARYDVDEQSCRADVNELLDQLRKLGLVETVDDPSA